MSQTIFIQEKIQSEPEITNAELSMQNDKELLNQDVFSVIYNYRQKNIEKSRKNFYLSRRRFLRKHRKLQLENKRESMCKDLRKKKQMELIQSFISLDCCCSDFLQQKQNQFERSESKCKDLLYQNGFLPFEYRS